MEQFLVSSDLQAAGVLARVDKNQCRQEQALFTIRGKRIYRSPPQHAQPQMIVSEVAPVQA